MVSPLEGGPAPDEESTDMDAPNATTSGRATAVAVDAPETAPARKATMKAVVQDRYGPPDVLELREIDQPMWAITKSAAG
jgi:hypothetical protein